MPAGQTGKTRTNRKTPPVTIAARSKAPATPAPPAKVPKAKKPSPKIGEGAWREMVATAAYYRAQARCFQQGSPEHDWLAAEAELKQRLAKAGKT